MQELVLFDASKRDVQLYAIIREESKYRCAQQKIDEAGEPVAFEVEIEFPTNPEWPVVGNDNRYTLSGVELFWKRSDSLIRIPMHSSPGGRD